MTSNNTTTALDWRKAWDHGVGERKDRRRIRARATCDTNKIELGAEESITGDAIDRGSVKRLGPDCLTVVNAGCPKKRPLRQLSAAILTMVQSFTARAILDREMTDKKERKKVPRTEALGKSKKSRED